MPSRATERVFLRNVFPYDWDALNAIVADPSVTRYMRFASWDEAKRHQWFARMLREASLSDRGGYNWIITLRERGDVIEWLFIGSSRDPAVPRGCGYAMDPRYWGCGYMPEALRAVFAYEFTTLGTRTIVAECDAPNIASVRVMEKCGMTCEGTFYDADFEGTWGERHHYRITREQWQAHSEDAGGPAESSDRS